MGIEEIEIEELRNFVIEAKKNGFNVDDKGGIVSLKGHKVHYDFEIFANNKTWEIKNIDTKEVILIPFGELNYSNGLLI